MVDKFAVYSTAIPLLNKESPEREPRTLEQNKLVAEKAVELAVRCTKRILMGRVIIVCETDDTVAWEWHHERGLIFPAPEDLD